MTSGVAITVPELIQLRHAARGISITSRRQVVNVRAGGYPSRFRGRGVDFAEVRSYHPGDDIRTIDWRVTARTGEPHTKLFREERERQALFLVDYSASMQFGTKVAFKSVIAAQTAAILAWAAVNNGDQVGGLVFAENRHQELPPNSGQAGILPLLNALAITPTVQPATRNSSFLEALTRLQHVATTGSLMFIISDFYQFDDQAEAVLGRLAQHNDIAAICIYDRLEQSLPAAVNLYSFAANEHQRLIINAADRSLRKAFHEQFELRQQQLQGFMQRLRMPMLSIATDQAPRQVLAQYWSKGKRG